MTDGVPLGAENEAVGGATTFTVIDVWKSGAMSWCTIARSVWVPAASEFAAKVRVYGAVASFTGEPLSTCRSTEVTTLPPAGVATAVKALDAVRGNTALAVGSTMATLPGVGATNTLPVVTCERPPRSALVA